MELQAAKAQHLRVEQEQRKAEAEASLSTGKRVAFFLLGMMGFPLIIVLAGYVRYFERGQHRRFGEIDGRHGSGVCGDAGDRYGAGARIGDGAGDAIMQLRRGWR